MGRHGNCDIAIMSKNIRKPNLYRLFCKTRHTDTKKVHKSTDRCTERTLPYIAITQPTHLKSTSSMSVGSHQMSAKITKNHIRSVLLTMRVHLLEITPPR